MIFFIAGNFKAVVAGSVIEEPVVRILYQGEIAAEVAAKALADDTPIYNRELLTEPPAYAKEAATWTTASLPGCDYEGIDVQGTYKTWNEILLKLLDTPTIASKQWGLSSVRSSSTKQYDSLTRRSRCRCGQSTPH